MKVILSLAFLAVAFAAEPEAAKPAAPAAADAADVDHVLALTKATFPDAIKSNDFILVEFYAPWCGHCKTLEPEYKKAAKQLHDAGSKVKLAKVDATIEQALAAEYKIEGFPTIKLFRNGLPSNYKGGRTAETILEWIKKKSGPQVKSADTKDALDALIKDSNVAVVAFANADAAPAKAINAVADDYDDVNFVIVPESVAASFDAKSGDIVVFRKFDEPKVVFQGTPDAAAVKEFVRIESQPLIAELTEKMSQEIFDGDYKHFVIIFASKVADGFTKVIEPLKPVAKENRGKFLFVGVDIDAEANQQIIMFFGITSIPAVRIVHIEPEMQRFKPESNEVTPEVVKAFIASYLDGKLQPEKDAGDFHLDSPNVIPLTAANFDEVVFDPTRNVIVEFTSTKDCPECTAFSVLIDQLSDSYKDSETVLFSRIDGSEHAISHSPVTVFPSLKIYMKGDNQAVDYTGELNLRSLILFIEDLTAAAEEVPQVDDEAAPEPVAPEADGELPPEDNVDDVEEVADLRDEL